MNYDPSKVYFSGAATRLQWWNSTLSSSSTSSSLTRRQGTRSCMCRGTHRIISYKQLKWSDVQQPWGLWQHRVWVDLDLQGGPSLGLGVMFALQESYLALIFPPDSDYTGDHDSTHCWLVNHESKFHNPNTSKKSPFRVFLPIFTPWVKESGWENFEEISVVLNCSPDQIISYISHHCYHPVKEFEKISVRLTTIDHRIAQLTEQVLCGSDWLERRPKRSSILFLCHGNTF